MLYRRDMYLTGRLTARPVKGIPDKGSITGLQPLLLQGAKDSFIYVPEGYNHNTPAALAVMLHGAGGTAEHGLSLLKTYADNNNIILLAPASQSYSWDIIADESFDRDVIYLDQALSIAFTHFAINPLLIAIGGFSDGASYALCIGLTNGDLFTHIIAFSPGFFFTEETKGKPGVFISHGTKDKVLPVNPCSRLIVSRLQHEGYKVDYREFDGGHEIPRHIAQAAVSWFVNGK